MNKELIEVIFKGAVVVFMVVSQLKEDVLKHQLISQSIDITELKQHQEILAKGYSLLNYQIDVVAQEVKK